MSDIPDRNKHNSLEGVPNWLLEALQERRVSPELRGRCREAAMVAHGIVMMRKKRAEVGFVPEPLDRYVGDLAQSAGVSLSSLLKWLGLKSLANPEPGNGRAYAKLAQALGMIEALHGHIVASLYSAEGKTGWALGKQAHTENPPQNAAAVLDLMEAALSPDSRRKLRLIELEITKGYESST